MIGVQRNATSFMVTRVLARFPKFSLYILGILDRTDDLSTALMQLLPIRALVGLIGYRALLGRL
jgi:hypothetical protein